jgi:hypothetical protein
MCGIIIFRKRFANENLRRNSRSGQEPVEQGRGQAPKWVTVSTLGESHVKVFLIRFYRQFPAAGRRRHSRARANNCSPICKNCWV